MGCLVRQVEHDAEDFAVGFAIEIVGADHRDRRADGLVSEQDSA